MGVTTWNVCGANGDSAERWLPTLVGKVGRGVICLQETENMQHFEYHGWSLYGSQGVKAAVLLPTEIAGSVVWASCLDNEFEDLKRTVGVSLGQVGIVSAYLEHGNYKIEDFVATVCEIEKQLEKLKELGCRNLVLGCDLNNALPSGILRRTGHFVKDEPKEKHAARVDRFLKLLVDYEMYAANTFGDGDKSKSFTRVPWKK